MVILTYIRVEIVRKIHLLAALVKDDHSEMIVVVKVKREFCEVKQDFRYLKWLKQVSTHIIEGTVEVSRQQIFLNNSNPVRILNVIGICILQSPIICLHLF